MISTSLNTFLFSAGSVCTVTNKGSNWLNSLQDNFFQATPCFDVLAQVDGDLLRKGDQLVLMAGLQDSGLEKSMGLLNVYLSLELPDQTVVFFVLRNGKIEFEGQDASGGNSGGVRAEILVQGAGTGTQGETEIIFKTSHTATTRNSEKLKIGNLGDVTISQGDLLFATSGKGVYLGVTSATASNLLDDYEEGTFNITSAGTGYAISAQGGVYTKIGDTCHIQFTLTFSSVNSGSNSTVTLSSLPFTSKNNGIASTGTIRESTNTGAIYVVLVQPNDSDFSINSMAAEFLHASSKSLSEASGFAYEILFFIVSSNKITS